MMFSKLANEMRAFGVSNEDIASIKESCEKSGYSDVALDEALVKLGYDKIFTVDYDDFLDGLDEDFEDDILAY